MDLLKKIVADLIVFVVVIVIVIVVVVVSELTSLRVHPWMVSPPGGTPNPDSQRHTAA